MLSFHNTLHYLYRSSCSNNMDKGFYAWRFSKVGFSAFVIKGCMGGKIKIHIDVDFDV